MHCTQVGTAELSGCSTQPRECTKRYAHDSLRTNYVSKQAVAYERNIGITADWSDALRIGNPIRRDLVTQCMMFTRKEQKKAGVAAKQALAVLPSHLHTIVSPLRARLQCTADAYTRVVLARDLALFTVAFETTKRGDKPSRTLIQRILRFPNLSVFLFDIQWGKTMRDGVDHLIQPRVFGNVPSHGRRTTYRRRISHRLGYDPGILIPEHLSRRGGRSPHSW